MANDTFALRLNSKFIIHLSIIMRSKIYIIYTYLFVTYISLRFYRTRTGYI